MADMRIGVLGAGGKVGSSVCRAVLGDPEYELVAAVDPKLSGIDLGQMLGEQAAGLIARRDVESLIAEDPEVVIDFTEARGSFHNLLKLAQAGIPAVVGTTGFTEEELDQLQRAFVGVGCIIASNFSIGAILMMRCAALCAPYFEGVEIVETHHDQKLDAPSGTSLETAQWIVRARQAAGEGGFPGDRTSNLKVEGVRGGVVEDEVRIHSLRLRGAVAHHEVIFGSAGQTLTIRHDSHDRASFVPGVLLAVARVRSLDRLVMGIDSLLGGD
ncbi:4-hydroxy-tetrahydrodipicolinate reductase [Ferrimicrobium sp.]|uniref:4-hydroxy-tetrahydrodipicolinate reductase n=1 Tax=Ferrimicrobium sp. TaxID=2926050 RepID=UPI00262C0650|nr:4-hydroxy-tetrahydrodipicolinate reductase [Ferrimicrobium sp.]